MNSRDILPIRHATNPILFPRIPKNDATSFSLLDIFIAYAVVVVGDIVGDIMYYALGYYRRQRFVKHWGRFLGITLERLERLQKHFEKHGGKALIIGKLSQGVGAVVLVAAGIARVPFLKFFRYNFIPTPPKSLIRLFLGYYSGKVILKSVHTSTTRRSEKLLQPSYLL